MTMNQVVPAQLLVEEPKTEKVFVERDNTIKMEERPKGRIHGLVDDRDPILRKLLDKFDFANPPTDPIQLSYDLIETMKKNHGLGLSANQIGLPYRVFVMETLPVLVCFNPLVVDSSEETIRFLEGCLSYPNLFVNITRPRVIRVRFTMPNGETITHKFQDLTARIYLHEVDHLDGKAFYERASLMERRRAFNKAKLANRRVKNA